MSLPTLDNVPNSFENLLDRDKRRFCFHFFYEHFAKEYFRLRSFDAFIYFRQSQVKELAKLGFFYTGSDKVLYNPKHYITCFYCHFEFCFYSVQCSNIDIAYVEEQHNKVRTSDCIEKPYNVSISNPLEKYKIYLAQENLYNPMTELRDYQCVNNFDTRILCYICKSRPLSVIYRPCGCIFACDYCTSQFLSTRCFNCDAKIEGYARVYIP